MATTAVPVLLALTLLLAASATAAAAEDKDSLYEALKAHGLPVGLIPNSVKSYNLTENGEFKVELVEPCYAQIQEPVYYDEIIEGELTAGAINNLRGIKARELLFWVQVTKIFVDPDSLGFIYFETGVMNKKLPTSLFDAPPTCESSSTAVADYLDSTVKNLRGGTVHPQ